MTNGRPIGEDDLHAFVDGFLDTERRLAVERYLTDHPDAAARIAGWQAANKALREAIGWKAQQPVPVALNVARLVEARLARRWSNWRIAAGVVLALMIGAGSGWMARGPGAPTGVASVGMEAMATYHMFAADDMHPVEFSADQRPQLVNWISRRLGRHVAPPDLSKSGYQFMGARLVATPLGPACMFVYSDAKQNRIELYVRPMEKRDMQAPMRPMQAKHMAGYTWANDGLGFGVVAGQPMPALHEISNQVRSEMGSQI
jgi:anti-sigma factor RsiW